MRKLTAADLVAGDRIVTRKGAHVLLTHVTVRVHPTEGPVNVLTVREDGWTDVWHVSHPVVVVR